MFGWFRRRPDDTVIVSLLQELAAERTARGYAMQRLAEVKLEHERELAEYRRRLSVAQANFEWLSVSYNRSDAERSQLMLGRIGVHSAPMVIQTDMGVQVPRASTLDELREQRDALARTPPSDIAEAMASGTLFDDVGDAEALRQGLQNGEVYDGRTTL